MKKICIYTANRSEYTRLRTVMEGVQRHPELQLMVVVGGAHLLERYGMTITEIERDGFPIVDRVYTVIEGSSLESMSKSAGLAIIELTKSFTQIKPDMLVVIGDRYDMLPAVITAAYLNIRVAHIQGGEKSGTIDESIRHAVSKLSHLHFPATPDGKELLIQMGEEPSRVFVTGCPSIDILLNVPEIDKKTLFSMSPIPSKRGRFAPDHTKDYIMCVQHPVTTEYADSYDQMTQTLEALRQAQLQTILIYPNLDAGSNQMVKALQHFSLKYKTDDWLFCYKHIPTDIFINLMRYAVCLVGNSSSGIRESCYLGLPTLNIGTRQKNRVRGKNVIDIEHSADKILQTIRSQIYTGRYPVEHLYGDGCAGSRIADLLASVVVEVQK